MTHDELVIRACRWLRGYSKAAKKPECRPAFAEFQHMCLDEMPDAIGWTGSGHVHVIEVKVSRRDFRADSAKMHHRSGNSMGHRRWYLVPKELVAATEIPEDYGLLYALPKTIRVMALAPLRSPTAVAGRAAESILRQAIIRHELGVEWRPDQHQFAPLESK